MIRLVASGSYRLSEARDAARFITLNSYGDECTYAWEKVNGIQLRLTEGRPAETNCALAAGKYRIYEVSDEPDLTSQIHLELSIGEGIWQGYLLPEGFPTDRKAKTVIPTEEIITRSFANVHLPIR